jgi:hypothetical protein
MYAGQCVRRIPAFTVREESNDVGVHQIELRQIEHDVATVLRVHERLQVGQMFGDHSSDYGQRDRLGLDRAKNSETDG